VQLVAGGPVAQALLERGGREPVLPRIQQRPVAAGHAGRQGGGPTQGTQVHHQVHRTEIDRSQGLGPQPGDCDARLGHDLDGERAGRSGPGRGGTGLHGLSQELSGQAQGQRPAAGIGPAQEEQAQGTVCRQRDRQRGGQQGGQQGGQAGVGHPAS